MTSDTYLLGHEERELQRLEDQARVIGPATTAILQLAGIESGMRVLDLGTGAGDVAFRDRRRSSGSSRTSRRTIPPEVAWRPR